MRVIFKILGVLAALCMALVALNVLPLIGGSLEETAANLRREAEAARAEAKGDYFSAKAIRETATTNDPRAAKARDLRLETFAWRMSSAGRITTDFTVKSNSATSLSDI